MLLMNSLNQAFAQESGNAHVDGSPDVSKRLAEPLVNRPDFDAFVLGNKGQEAELELAKRFGCH